MVVKLYSASRNTRPPDGLNRHLRRSPQT